MLGNERTVEAFHNWKVAEELLAKKTEPISRP